MGCRLWGRTESDTTEATQQQQQQQHIVSEPYDSVFPFPPSFPLPLSCSLLLRAINPTLCSYQFHVSHILNKIFISE